MLRVRTWACILINFKQHLLDSWPFQHRRRWCWAEGSRGWSHAELLEERSSCYAESWADASPQGRVSLPRLRDPGWTPAAGCVISTVPLLPLLAAQREGRNEQNSRVHSWCRDDPVGSPTKYFVWTNFRAQSRWLQSPWTQPAWVRWQTRLSSPQHSLSLPHKPSLATPGLWEWGICVQGSAC